MFDFLPEVARDLRGHILDLYWVLIVPVFVISIISEFMNLPDGSPNPSKVLKRVLVSVFLLLTFDYTINTIALLGDGVAEKIDGIKPLWSTLEEIGQKFSSDSSGGWFQVRSTIVYIMGLLSYFIAYLGVFVANALIHFVWAILFIASPLMILAFVNEKSAYITASLYKGLINVVLWKIVAAILGVLMLKLITSNQAGEDWATSFSFIAVNLCVGLSLLFVPMTTKSLLGDGLNSMASGLAAAPAYAAFGASKLAAKAALSKGTGAAIFGARPVSNYLQRKMSPITSRVAMAKRGWEQMGKNDPKKKVEPSEKKNKQTTRKQ
ncbi:MAG: hypothetical protein JNL11_01505 [Bdellovibrionaceae bacterium]|nr:hypothetical protein [Pseudobdellovibrionaceae bacterium]